MPVVHIFRFNINHHLINFSRNFYLPLVPYQRNFELYLSSREFRERFGPNFKDQKTQKYYMNSWGNFIFHNFFKNYASKHYMNSSQNCTISLFNHLYLHKFAFIYFQLQVINQDEVFFYHSFVFNIAINIYSFFHFAN